MRNIFKTYERLLKQVEKEAPPKYNFGQFKKKVVSLAYSFSG